MSERKSNEPAVPPIKERVSIAHRVRADDTAGRPATGGKTTGTSDNDFTPKIGIRMIQIFQLFLVVAIIMYSASVVYSSHEGMLGIYIWLAISLILTVVAGFHYTYSKPKTGELTNDELSKAVSKSTFRKIVNFLPNFGCIVPVMLIIYVFIKIKPILSDKNLILPEEFTWYNNLSFFLIVLLFFMTGKVYNALLTKSKHADLWSGGVLLFSVLAIVTTIKLYVITISFITDG